MLTQRFVLVPLLAALLLGCNRTDPAPVPPVVTTPVGKGKDMEKPANKAVDDPKKLPEYTAKELAQLQVFVLIDGLRDDTHSGEIYSKVQRLRDTAKSMSVGGAGAYGKSDRCIRISPIIDMEAASAKVDFGLVVAVDTVNRVLLVDASAKPAPRPDKGWPGAKAIDQYVVRKLALEYGPKYTAVAEALKQFGRDKLVLVCVCKGFDSAALLEKLKSLGTVTKTEVEEDEVIFCPQYAHVTLYTLAPVAKMSEVTKVLAGMENVGVDEELRFVLGGLDAVKPRTEEVKKQSAPPK